MSRLDQQIATVRGKLTIALFVQALAWLALGYATLVWAVIIAERLLNRPLPRSWTLFFVGCGSIGVATLVYSLVRRPSSKVAAVAIDQTLGLKEKFSTALYVRQFNDPFSAAVVCDAEQQANHVSLANRFAIRFPRQSLAAGGVAMAALLTAWLMPYISWGNNPTRTAMVPQASPAPVQTRDLLAPELPKIESALNALNNNDEAIKRAKEQLAELAKMDELDPKGAHRTVNETLEQTHQTLAEQIAKNEKFHAVEDINRQLGQMDAPEDDSSLMGQAQNELKQGNVDAAMDKITAAVEQFEKAKPEDQAKTAEQAKQLADQLKKVANDPKVQQKLKDQMAQMGATQQQAQQMSQLMQQAANGNSQAAQQLQQMAKQMTQNMNGGQGPSQQQAQKIQQMMAQMQGLANSQAQAQALANSAQQLAQAMKNSAAQGSQQGQNPAGQNQLAGAQAQMQKQLGNMQAAAQDAKAMQAGLDASGQAADAALGGQNGNPNGQNSPPGQPANNGQPGRGGIGPGGAKMGIAEAPFGVQKQMDVGKENKNGKILLARQVLAGIDPGQSTAARQEVAKQAEQEAPDEIDIDHLPRDSQQAVKDYFTTLQKADTN